MAGEIRKFFIRHWHKLADVKLSPIQLHQDTLSAEEKLWRHFRSTKTCAACFTHLAAHVQKCRHALCDMCVQIYGTATGPDYHYIISQCPLCTVQASLSVRVKPPTSGVRLLTIDGGGCRGVIPLQFLVLLQQQLGQSCSLLDLVDLAVGTSSGELHETCGRLLLTQRRWLDSTRNVPVPVVSQ